MAILSPDNKYLASKYRHLDSECQYLASHDPLKEWFIKFWPPPEGIMPNFEPIDDLKRPNLHFAFEYHVT